MQQWLYTCCIQFIQLINKANHLLKIVFNFFFFLQIKFEACQVSKLINQFIIYFHQANILFV